MAIEPSQNTPPLIDGSRSMRGITRGQKVGFVFLFVFACLSLGLGFLQMRTVIYGPFVASQSGQVSAAEQAQRLFDETLRLQRIDTDQDGVNDFEEMNFYGTSAYLPDTDSDGLSDKKEIDDGTDPLCPEGKDCGLGVGAEEMIDVSTQPSSEHPLFENAFDTTGTLLGSGASQSPTGFDLGAMLQNPAQLRAAILSTGQIDPNILSQMSDDELLDLAQQALKAQSGTEVVQSAPTQDVTSEQLEAVLSQPQELRALLLSTGKMTQAQLDRVDDTTLIAVTREIIEANRE